MSRSRLFLAALVAVTPLIVGCENGPLPTTADTTTTTTTVTSPVTETFTGQLNIGGYAFRSFVAAKAGTATVTLTSVAGSTSTTGAKVGFGLGLVDATGSGCIFTRSAETSAGGQLTAAVDAGTYCVRVWDLGTLSQQTAFLVTIVRP